MADEIDEGIISFKWMKHSSTFFNVLSNLRVKEIYTDATLACEGKFYPIHKLVLSACSDYFLEIFGRTNCRSPVVILKDIRNNDLEALLDYMYNGEVDICQTDLSELLKAANCLRVKGLAVPDDEECHFLTPKKASSPVDCKFSPDECIVTPSLNVDISNNSLPTPKKYSYTNENYLSPDSPPTKRIKRGDQLITDNEPKQVKILTSPNILKPLNAIEVPLQFQSASSMSPVFPQSFLSNVSPTSKLDITSLKTTKSKTKSHLVSKCRSQRATKPLKSEKKIKTFNPIKIIRPRNRSKINVKPTVSSDSQGPNKNVFYVNHEDINTSDEMENAGEEATLPQKLNFDLAINHSLNKSLEQPGTSSTATPKRKRNRPKNLTSIVDEFCEQIGVPNFSTELMPYLEGQKLEKKDKLVLGNMIIDELIEHWNIHNMFDIMTTNYLRSLFFFKYQTKITDKYPNIIIEECTRKNKRRGTLSFLFHKLASKISRRVRKVKMLLSSPPQYTENGDLPAQSPLKRENSDEGESFDHDNNRMEFGLESFASDNEEEFLHESLSRNEYAVEKEYSHEMESNFVLH